MSQPQIILLFLSSTADTSTGMFWGIIGHSAFIFFGGISSLLPTALFFGLVMAFATTRLASKNDLKSLPKPNSPMPLDHYKAFFDAANDAIFIHDVNTCLLVDINQKACELMGYGKHEYLQLTPEATSPGISPFMSEDAYERVRKAARGEPQLFEWLSKRKNGELIWLEVNLKLVNTGEQAYVLAIAHDISERKIAEEAMSKRLAYESMLTRISLEAVTADDLSAYMDLCLKIMAEVLDVDRIFIYEHDSQTDWVRLLSAWRSRGAQTLPLIKRLPAKRAKAIIDGLKRNEIISCACSNDWPHELEKKLMLARGIESILAVPLFVDGTFFGFLGFADDRARREWPEEDVELLRTTAHIIASVIQRTRLEAVQRMQVSAIEGATDQIIVAGMDGLIKYVNPAFERETGFSNAEVIGKPKTIFRCDLYDESYYEEIWRLVYSGETWINEATSLRKDGSYSIDDVAITPVKNKAGEIEHIVVIKRNITEKKNYEQKLDHMAHHDPLTGLPNRLLFGDRLTQGLAQARRDSNMLAVMFLDLDRFKIINDTLGHNLGDLLLRQVAKRLSAALREVDTIARMGGDEFTLIIRDIHGPQDAILVAERALQVFTDPFVVDCRELFVTASIGVSIYPTDGVDVETLVRNADASMYKAKEHGRNAYHLYTESISASSLERIELEHDLRKAVEKDEFVVYYQPRVDIRSGKIHGAEALVRWQHPTMGMIMPNQFIPLAEETGLIIPLGKQVLKMACAQNRLWQDQGFGDMNVSVNISARHFQENDLPCTVKQTLSETRLHPSCLELELTESTLMHSPDIAVEALDELKSLGVKISIDDFGTGYSSLAYLKRFPVDSVKIDRSFVKEITTNPDDAAIAGAVVAMAHNLNLTVIAEGVETLDHLRFLKSLNCDEMQGYFVSKPVPAYEMTQLLEQQNRTLALLMTA